MMVNRQSICSTLILIACFLLTKNDAVAQGFDWQYSSRLPSSSPSLFFGGGVKLNYGFHTADIYTLGDEYSCGDYKTGDETGFTVGLAAEYWQTGTISFWGEAGYRYSPAVFTSTTAPEPFKRNGGVDTLVREFQMKSVFHAIEIQSGVKWRFAPSHIHIVAGIRATIVMSNEVEQSETIVKPIDITESILYPTSKINSIYTVLVVPVIGIGYDMELGRGIYATPKITVGLPLMSYSSATSWKSWDYSAGITVLTHF